MTGNKPETGDDVTAVKTWHEGMSDKESRDLAYWERNVLALLYAEGWYNDDFDNDVVKLHGIPRFPGWRRVLSLEGGSVTFHIPDDFDIGHLKQIEPNWDGHTTETKWRSVLAHCGVKT